MKENQFKQILPESERYCIPSINEIKFISNKQTLSLALGSCISTVFIGKGDSYLLAANHIVIASPGSQSIIAKKGAAKQIEEIFNVFKEAYNIDRNDVICFQLVGAGHKNIRNDFSVDKKNIEDTIIVLSYYSTDIIFNDTGSFYYSSYSIYNNNLSVFIENKNDNTHKSYTIDLEALFNLKIDEDSPLPASSLNGEDAGFEFLVEKNIITAITGARRKYGNVNL